MRSNAARVAEGRNVFAAAEARFREIVRELGSVERQHMNISDLEKLLQRQGSGCCASCCRVTWTCAAWPGWRTR